MLGAQWLFSRSFARFERPCSQQRGLLPVCTAFPFHSRVKTTRKTVGLTKIGKTNLGDGLKQSINSAVNTGVDRKSKTAGRCIL